MANRLSPVLLLVLSFGAAAGTLYRWVDKDGGVHYSDLPPQSEVRRLDVKEVGSGNFVETSSPSYALSTAQTNFPVTLYAAPDCGNDCASARDFLARRGIPYSEINVATTETAAQFKNVFGASDVFIPSITIGNEKLRGFEQAMWARMLDEAGYPSGNPTTGGSAAKTPRPTPTTP